MNEELSFFEFTQLSQETQYELAFTQGEFVGVSEKKEVRFVLYKLFTFFVEIVYDSKDNKIINLTSFMKNYLEK